MTSFPIISLDATVDVSGAVVTLVVIAVVSRSLVSIVVRPLLRFVPFL